jgi:hypothetical protein
MRQDDCRIGPALTTCSKQSRLLHWGLLSLQAKPGCAAVMWPQIAQAQKSDRTRRVGVLGSAEDDPQTEEYLKA